MKIYDLSPLIHEKTAVFPGDVAFKREVSLNFNSGFQLLLSSMKSTLHLGSHSDAPNHYHPQGVGIHQREVSLYFGPCQVIRPKISDKERIYPRDFEGIKIESPRVLIDTQSYEDPDNWKDDFLAFSPELVEYLASEKVKLIGIDTPSVDPANSKNLESHKQIFISDMAILEGLQLKGVPEGLYFLMALPLKILDGDASPVRAILIELREFQEWINQFAC